LDVEELFERISEEVPEVSEMLVEHLEYFDNLLPYVFLNEVIEWSEDPARSSDKEAKLIVGVLEQEYDAAEPGLRDMIDIQLLENLSRKSRLAPMLGPALARTFEQYRALGEM
jgi:hypothetical protein